MLAVWLGMMMMRILLFITLTSGAPDLHCTVTQEAGRWKFEVGDFTPTSATDCQCDWFDGNDMLASNLKMETHYRVVNHSSTTLITSQYLQGVRYHRFCFSELRAREAKCNSPDTTAHNTTTHHNATADPPLEEPETRHKDWIIAAVVLAAIALAAIALLAFILLPKKCKNPRCPTGSTSYTEVQMENLQTPQQS